MTNPTLTLSRFLSATSDATAEDAFTATVWNDDPGSYDMTVLLQTYLEHQRDSRRSDYFSFSNWSGGHDQSGHEGSTALTLEFTAATADLARATLIELGIAHYEIPTKAGRKHCILFAFPVDQPFDTDDTTRAASLIAEGVKVRGITRHSFIYTYFFRFRDGTVAFRDGELMSRQYVHEANVNRVITGIKKYLV